MPKGVWGAGRGGGTAAGSLMSLCWISALLLEGWVVRENFMVLKGVSRPGTPLITVSWGDP